MSPYISLNLLKLLGLGKPHILSLLAMSLIISIN